MDLSENRLPQNLADMMIIAYHVNHVPFLYGHISYGLHPLSDRPIW